MRYYKIEWTVNDHINTDFVAVEAQRLIAPWIEALDVVGGKLTELTELDGRDVFVLERLEHRRRERERRPSKFVCDRLVVAGGAK